MRRLCVTLLLAVSGLAQEDDPRVHNYKVWFTRAVKLEWAGEETSEGRKVIVTGFSKHDVAPAATWLMNNVVAMDDAADVVREAIRVLSNYKNPDSVKAMARIYASAYKKDWESRALTVLAFGKIRSESTRAPIEAALKDKDPRVVQAACRAVGAGRRIEFKEHLKKHLKHKHPIVRGAAAMALAELRASETMPLVFNVFCTDKSWRARYDAWLAMKELTLQKKLGHDPKEWQGWWEEQVKEIPEGEPNPWGTDFPRQPKGKPATWFSIPVGADRIVCVLDSTQHINNGFKVDIAAQRKMDKAQRIPGFFSVKTRWDLIQAYTDDCIKRLPDKIGLGFVFFRTEIHVFPETGKLLKLNRKARGQIRTYLEDEVKKTGVSAMFDGLAKGWGWLKGGEPTTNFRKGADTILFATCSQPARGTHKNREDRIIDECWRIAVTRGVRFHVVGIHNHAFGLLKAMAKDSGGLYVHVQEADDPAEPQDLDFWPEKKKKFEAERKQRKRRGGR